MYSRKKKRGGSAQLRNLNSEKAKELSKVYENYLVKREQERKNLKDKILGFRLLKNQYFDKYLESKRVNHMFSFYGAYRHGIDNESDNKSYKMYREYEKKEKEAIKALQQIPKDNNNNLSRMLTRRILGKIHPLFSNSAFMNEIWKYTGNVSPPRSATRKKATTT
jgi:hypothetical protein